MMDNLDEVTELRLRAMQEIEKNKLRVARAYNKKVVPKSFAIGDLVWKTILPINSKGIRFGKWSPTWDRLYKVIQVNGGNSYVLETLEGEKFPKCLDRNITDNSYINRLHSRHAGVA